MATVPDGGGVAPARLRPADAHLFDEALRRVAAVAAGVRLGLRTNSSTITVGFRPREFTSADGPVRADLSINGEIVDTAVVGADGIATLQTGITEVAELEVWLPHRGTVAVDHVTVDDRAQVEASTREAPVWLAHGSSITQSRFSTSPAMSWPSQVARTLGLDLFNLGFAGECQLEPVIARMMAAMPADIISVCAGINPYTSISMSERVYRANLAGFITILRDSHPTAPILVSSPIASPKRESTPNHPRVPPPFARRLLRSQRARLPVGSVGPTLIELRDATHDVAGELVNAGDANLHVVDGRTLLSASDAEHLVDGLHPDQLGEDVIAERYGPLLAPLAQP